MGDSVLKGAAGKAALVMAGGTVDEPGLPDLENAANDAYMAYSGAVEAAEAAKQNTASAEQAYDEAVNQYMYGDGSPESLEKMQEAQQALDAAREAEKAAAEAAAEAVEQKKEELRAGRQKDTTYVVHCARIECTCGMRESYLALGPTHGVKTRQIPQMITTDAVLDTNIINFGGCLSKENPSLIAAAEEAARKANEEIRKKKEEQNFLNKVVDRFCGGGGEVRVSDSLLEQCVGECKDCFPAGAKWRVGHMKVSINGKPVLLRRCSARCIYGGLVTILLSGQPE